MTLPPPILEKEDEVIISRPPATPEAEDSYTRAVEKIDQPDQETEWGGRDEDTKERPTLGPERSMPTINNHIEFWSTYDKVSGAFDQEFIDAWNKSLDVLLIFAGLFSAINTAFIIESYRGLQPDPAEITNALLRIFILHRNDNTTLSIEDLNPGLPASSAVAINSIFFSSLSFSLTAAFGAVTAKQWLTEYTAIGATKAMHIQGRMRQKKYHGLKTWHLRLIIELLPMLLQISLLLFLVGTVQFLWTLDRNVAMIQLILSGVGIAIYFLTIVIGIIFPNSPFRTPLTIYIPRYFTKAYCGMKVLLSVLDLDRLIEPLRVATGKFKWIEALKSALNEIDIIIPLRGILTQGVSILRQQMGYTNPNGNPDSEPMELGKSEWDPEDITAADSVVWLLEQAEHPDVTVIALDAVPRLPPDLVLYLLEQREGLLERLIQFHKSLLPPSRGVINTSWMMNWSNRAMVSGAALWHVFKAKPPASHGDIFELDSLSVQQIQEEFTNPINAIKFYLTWNHSLYGYYALDEYLNVADHFQFVGSSTGSYQFLLELTDTRQASAFGTFTTSISPFFLHLDAIFKIAYTYSVPLGLYENSLSRFLRSLSSHMQGELPPEVVSYIALVTAVLYWRFGVDQPSHEIWSYPSTRDQRELKQMLISRFYHLDKSKTLLENVALALSLIDTSTLDVTILRTLIMVTEGLFLAGHFVIDYPNLPQSLIRLTRHFPDDYQLQSGICSLLGRCVDGDWASPLHQDYGGEIIRLLGSGLHPRNNNVTSELLNMIARALDETQFLHLMSPGTTGLYQYHAAIARGLRRDVNVFAGGFVMKTLFLGGVTDHQGIRIAHISFLAAILSVRSWLWADSVSIFFNQNLENQTELHWPAYFISEGIISSHTKTNDNGNSSPVTSLNYDDVRNFFYGGLYSGDDVYKVYAFRGEALLLLWRIAKQQHANGGFSSDWSDDIFFERETVDTMLDYHNAIKGISCPGIDRRVLRNYFKRALDTTEVTEDLNHGTEDSDSPQRFGDRRLHRRRRKDLETVLERLDDHSFTAHSEINNTYSDLIKP